MCTALDHGLLAVGYGVAAAGGGGVATPYWKLKNDFGLDWGEQGYARIERGGGQPGGQCGILLDASYPVRLH